MSEDLRFNLNGKDVRLGSDPETPLLLAVRNKLGLRGSRYGCGLELCGACMVLVDGEAEYSCARPIYSVAGRSVTTVEGLMETPAGRALRTAILEGQAGQCGYCLSGILVTSAALLRANPDPSDAEIRGALDRNLCRCGVHNRIVRAVRNAAAALRAEAGR